MKKNLLTISLFLIFIAWGNAQSVILTPSDSLYKSAVVTSNSDDVLSTAYVENTTNDTLNFSWRIIELDANTPTNWEMTLCDNTQCPVLYLNQVESFKLAPDSTSILKFGILPFLEAGSTKVTVRVFAQGTSFDTIITYKTEITANPTAIKELDTKSISIFPNPASNFIQIKGLENSSYIKTLEVYNIIGRKLVSKQINSSNDLNVDIQNYESGIYLVKLFDESKNVFYTKTFIKK